MSDSMHDLPLPEDFDRRWDNGNRQDRIDETALQCLRSYLYALKSNPEGLTKLREAEPHGPLNALVRECYDLAYLMEAERQRRIDAEGKDAQ